MLLDNDGVTDLSFDKDLALVFWFALYVRSPYLIDLVYTVRSHFMPN